MKFTYRKLRTRIVGKAVLTLDSIGHWIADGPVAEWLCQFLEG